MRTGQDKRRTIAWAVVGAVAAHGLLLWWLSSRLSSGEFATEQEPTVTSSAPAQQPAAVSLVPIGTPVDTPERGAPIDSVLGTHARAADTVTQSAPRADRDLPGRRRASLGGGAAGGPDSFTGRDDRENFQAQTWNDPTHNRLPRKRTDTRERHPRSPESMVRRATRGHDDIDDTRTRAHAGTRVPTPGGATGDTSGGAGLPLEQRDWRDADPMFEGPNGIRVPERVDGRTGHRGHVGAEQGANATEADRRGATRDREHTSAASDELDPAPVELSNPRSGGDRDGVVGPRARDGLSAQGTGSSGTSASRATAEPDAGEASVRARRRNPYFRRMYRRMDRYIEFPEQLALSLRQGEVVIRFALSADGEMSKLAIVKHSGHEAFDRQVVTAVRRAAPFGAVPTAILDGRSTIIVLVPYTFKNSLIRE